MFKYINFFLLAILLLIFSCDEELPVLEGCTTSTACNYSVDADKDDGSCIATQGCNEWCDGDTTPILVFDCADNCGGDRVEDNCGTCDNDASNDCVPDCTTQAMYDDNNGTCEKWVNGQCWGGNLELDECGVCGGTGIPFGKCDCDGNVEDCTGVCDGDAVGDECPCLEDEIKDCAGVCDGEAVEDECGVCYGVITNVDDCPCDNGVVADCAGVCDGEAVEDECGVCGGSGIPDGDCDCNGNVDLGCGCGEAGPSGCDNACGSTLENDECGVCGGSGIPDGECDCAGSNDCIGCNDWYMENFICDDTGATDKCCEENDNNNDNRCKINGTGNGCDFSLYCREEFEMECDLEGYCDYGGAADVEQGSPTAAPP
jgi:hypothetical protein